MKLHTRLLILIYFGLLSSLVFAGSTGKISGNVIDASTGEGLPFANVFINGTGMGAATDIDGHFTILNVPPGVYSVKIGRAHV